MATKPQTSRIIEVLETLKKFQKGTRKTTLNREAKDTGNYTPYQTLISCLLSLRAKDEVTEVISENLFKYAKTPEAMLKIPVPRLKEIIFKSGHYNKKAEAIRHVSQQLIERFNSNVPDTYGELISIKHIGPKTANIVLCFSFNKQVIPVDTHVHRIPNRLGWLSTKTPEQTEKELEKTKLRFPPSKKGAANIFVLKDSTGLKKYGEVTTIIQTFVDIWNLNDWYGADFIKALETKINAELKP